MGSTRQNRNRKQTVLERVKAIPHKTFILAVLGIALLGASLQILTPAQGTEELVIPGSKTFIRFINDGNINGPQDPGDTIRESTISVDIESGRELPKSQILVFYTYNTKVLNEPIKVTCHWRHGCFKSGWKGPQRQFTHGARIVTCHNVPANFRVTGAPVVTIKSHLKANPPSTDEAIDNIWYGYAKGSCQSNPRAKGLVITTSIDGCESTYHLCGPVGGSAPNYVGFTPLKTGTGNGNGGNGAGTNGNGSGGGGSGGSTAKIQSEKPNSLPDASSQGNTKQPELSPSPFYDGKQYKSGSDPDDFVFGSSTINGRKVPKLLLYGISILLLVGAGAAMWWWKRRRSTKG